MIKNNMLSVLIHVCVWIITGILYFITRGMCSGSDAAKITIYALLLVLAITLYIMSGRFLKSRTSVLANIFSVVLPSIVGVGVYIMSKEYFNNHMDTSLAYIVYFVYNMPFTPLIDVTTYITRDPDAYKHWWIVFSFLPTLFIYINLQVRAIIIKRQSKGHEGSLETKVVDI